jgi:hypothetical protein
MRSADNVVQKCDPADCGRAVVLRPDLRCNYARGLRSCLCDRSALRKGSGQASTGVSAVSDVENVWAGCGACAFAGRV